ncbi:hypothetical protein [Bacteroides sp. 51]|uniref:hypothetical protein n=1 Tax=Bacteroides sp. 51 TaxID=2302938 RepID=UPI0013D3B6A0|nr:hypothetical protein [Bacteroides sp. 51]
MDKKSEIENIKKRIEQEKGKIKACQSNIAHFRRSGRATYQIDGEKKKIESIKKTISKMREDIAKIRSKK